MQRPKPKSVTVAIVAQNHEEFITYLLRSLIKQNTKRFKLERIIVLCDGSSDRTASKVSGYVRKYPLVTLMYYQETLGTSRRLEQLSPTITSDLTVVLQPDVVLKGTNCLHNMISQFFSKKTVLIMPQHIPIKVRGLVPALIRVLTSVKERFYKTVKDTAPALSIKSGAFVVKTSFLQSARFPQDVSIAHYLYFAAKYAGHLSFPCDNSDILYYLPRTIKSYLKEQQTSLNMRKLLFGQFGMIVVDEYTISLRSKLQELLHLLINRPVASIISIIFGVCLLIIHTTRYLSNHHRIIDLPFQTKKKLSTAR